MPVDIRELIEEALELAATAPSAHNMQPWRVSIEGTMVRVHRDIKLTLGAGDPTLRQTFLSLGAFVEAIVSGLKALGADSDVHVLAFKPSQSPVVAEIRVTERKATPCEVLKAALLVRRTNRGRYTSEPLAEEVEHKLDTVPVAPGVRLVPMVGGPAKSSVAELVRQGTLVGLRMPAIREELSQLVSYSDERGPVGLVYEAMTRDPRPEVTAGAWLLDRLDVKQEADDFYQKYAEAPALYVIATDYESADAWIEAGRTLFRLLIVAAEHGLSHCISAAPVEVPTLAGPLRALMPEGHKPQAIVRLGKALDPAFHGPRNRRSVRDFTLPEIQRKPRPAF